MPSPRELFNLEPVMPRFEWAARRLELARGLSKGHKESAVRLERVLEAVEELQRALPHVRLAAATLREAGDITAFHTDLNTAKLRARLEIISAETKQASLDGERLVAAVSGVGGGFSPIDSAANQAPRSEGRRRDFVRFVLAAPEILRVELPTNPRSDSARARAKVLAACEHPLPKKGIDWAQAAARCGIEQFPSDTWGASAPKRPSPRGSREGLREIGREYLRALKLVQQERATR